MAQLCKLRFVAPQKYPYAFELQYDIGWGYWTIRESWEGMMMENLNNKIHMAQMWTRFLGGRS